MNRIPFLRWMSRIVLLSPLVATSPAWSHGSMIIPESRVYNCFLNNPENPTDPACRAAKDLGGSQAFYDWNGVNQANANSNHQAVVPDGKLCSGNNPTFRGLDLARGDWQATSIAPRADGTFEFVFRGTAPHATKDWIFYVTRHGWSPTQPLRWADLFEFCRLGHVPLDGDRYRLRCPLPQLTGRHIVYTVWQRSDSTEAFYTCTDVEFTGGTNPTWTDAGPLTAQNALPVGTAISLRLFSAGGADVETTTHTLVAGQAAAADWPFFVAQTVNAQSTRARIGVIDAAGTVTPVRAANGNRVYTLASANLRHQVDIRLPDTNTPPTAVVSANPTSVTGAGDVALSGAGSSDPDGQALTFQWQIVAGAHATLTATTGAQSTLRLTAPAQDQTVTVQLTVSDGVATDSRTVAITHRKAGGGNVDYVYPAGIGNYVAGQTIVLGSDGQRYQCRPYPQGGWCNINSAYHYAPGTGTHWQDAWVRL
ncbi:lytic polysaccharide monooxygenase auxiliary activity family 9 protein [Tahibacter amnicola]|uniref:Lytic polysaccharide monooxygenase n=1 Tax=Tahibacter amnicola TaxID=2976241 RepID=A0ABY6BLW0_9GAMM|nr:lytic polysaccharide monooxygenase [Tahibacter amnicola]UXI68802.1 lytic polysaccharide monooxygenase [Tahibacter amnicola]